MLEIIGERLEEMGTTVVGQEKRSFDRLEHILYAVAQYNPNVLTLKLSVLSGEELGWNEVSSWRVDVEGKRLTLAQKRLQQAAPFYDFRQLDRLRQDMLDN